MVSVEGDVNIPENGPPCLSTSCRCTRYAAWYSPEGSSKSPAVILLHKWQRSLTAVTTKGILTSSVDRDNLWPIV